MSGILAFLFVMAVFIRGQIVLLCRKRFRPVGFLKFASDYQRAMSRYIFRFTRWFGDMRLIVEPYDESALPPVFLLISNHQSLLDIPAHALALPRHQLRWVAKRELGHGIPYISANLRLGRHALISRTGDYREGHKELLRLARMSRQGICPVVFPEGTRSRTGALQSFHAGAVRIIAEHAELPVLAVAVDGGYRVSRVHQIFTSLRGARYTVKILSLYPAPKGKKEIQEMLDTIHDEIKGQLMKWRGARP